MTYEVRRYYEVITVDHDTLDWLEDILTKCSVLG